MAVEVEAGRAFKSGVPVNAAPAKSLEIRENFRALFGTNYTTSTAYPANPKLGTLRVLADPADNGNVKLQAWVGLWVTLLQNVQLGVPTPTKIIVATYQTPPGSASWLVQHDLGTKPLVQVVRNPGGVLLMPKGDAARSDIRFLGRLPTAGLVAGAVRTGIALPFNGTLLRTFAVCETAIGAPADFTVTFTLAGAALSPKGDIHVSGAQSRGAQVNGAGITGNSGAFAEDDTLDVSVTVASAPAAGAVELYAELERGLQSDEYKVTHVNDNRLTIDFAAATAGFAILVG